jgi:hypothetical protein
MEVRISAITNYVMGWSTFIATRDLQDRFVRFLFVQNQMCAEATGVPRTCVAYDVNHDLWRLREAAGVLYFETGQGPTPNPWRIVHSVPTPFDVTRVRAMFGTSTDRNINTSISLSVDRFN